jgi:membrane associated rhomboid family serine protease
MLSIPSTKSSPDEVKRLKRAFYIVLGFAGVLWIIELLKFSLNLDLFSFGVHPQQTIGLVGILTAPLIHSSFEHLVSNTPAILILGTTLLFGYPRSCWWVISIVWSLTELGVWFTARPVSHFGASGLTYGFMAFIFFIGMIRRDRLAITLSLLVFFLYGTMIWGIFPHQPGVSYETHLWGAGLGVICAFIFRKYDPAPVIKHYSWENDDENDPVIGDAWNNLKNQATQDDDYV